MDREIAWTKFGAYLLTDGAITIEGDRGLYASLINNDPMILEDFIETLKSLGLNASITKSTRSYRIRKGCTAVLRKLMKEYSILTENGSIMKSKAKIPKNVVENKGLASEFLRIVASTEGYVRFTRNNKGGYAKRIILGSSNRRLSEFFSKMLDTMEIESKMSDNGVIIYGRENLQKFHDTIGFVHGCKTVRGKNKGMEKMQVLRDILSSYRSRRAKHP